jgi:hypothetical protein
MLLGVLYIIANVPKVIDTANWRTEERKERDKEYNKEVISIVV